MGKNDIYLYRKDDHYFLTFHSISNFPVGLLAQLYFCNSLVLHLAFMASKTRTRFPFVHFFSQPPRMASIAATLQRRRNGHAHLHGLGEVTSSTGEVKTGSEEPFGAAECLVSVWGEDGWKRRGRIEIQCPSVPSSRHKLTAFGLISPFLAL